jgi:hypothetical protein
LQPVQEINHRMANDRFCGRKQPGGSRQHCGRSFIERRSLKADAI